MKFTKPVFWLSFAAVFFIVIAAEQKCSYNKYMVKLGFCWVPLVMDTLSSAQSGMIFAVLKNLCPKFPAYLDCQERVDRECGLQAFSVPLVRKFIKDHCANIGIFGGLTCATQSSKNLLPCISKLDYTGNLCEVVKGFHGCFTDMFQKGTCDPKVVEVMSSLMQLYYPNPCLDNPPITPNDTPCSATAVAAGLFLCVTKPVIGGILNAKMGLRIMQSFCQTQVFSRTVQCFTEVNKMCNVNIINTQELRLAVGTMCNNINELSSIATCISGTDAAALGVCAKGVRLKDQDTLCSATNDYKTCTNGLVSKCPNGIQALIRQGYDAVSLSCPLTENPRCSFVEHLFTHAACWFPTVQILIPMTPGQPHDIWQKVIDMCGMYRSIMHNSISCMAKADKVCNRVMIKENVLKRATDSVCDGISDYRTMTCVNSELQTYFVCMVNAKTIDISSSTYENEISTHVMDCTRKLFSKCSSKIRTSINGLMVAELQSSLLPGGSASLTMSSAVTMVLPLVATMYYV